MSTPTAARTSQIVTNPDPVLWSDGTPFDGFIAFFLNLPTTGYSAYTMISAGSPLYIPLNTKVPVIGGTVSSAYLFYNADLVPPGSQYSAYWYSRQRVLINPPSGSATPFSVTAATTTVTAPTLTVPTYGTTPVPQPVSTPASGGVVQAQTLNAILLPVAVTYSATPEFDVSQGNWFFITLTGNVTSSTITFGDATPYNGQQIEIRIKQDGTGGHTFVLPVDVLGARNSYIDAAANTTTVLQLGYYGGQWLCRNVITIVEGGA